MLADHHWYHLGPGEVTTILVAIIGLIGLAMSNRHRSNKVEQKVDKVIDLSDTGNDKKLGTYIHEIAQLQEIISTQLHTNTKELLIVAEKLDRHIESENPHRSTLPEVRDGTG